MWSLRATLWILRAALWIIRCFTSEGPRIRRNVDLKGCIVDLKGYSVDLKVFHIGGASHPDSPHTHRTRLSLGTDANVSRPFTRQLRPSQDHLGPSHNQSDPSHNHSKVGQYEYVV
eukprot:805281-Prorocentrum_minimum.AAC.1